MGIEEGNDMTTKQDTGQLIPFFATMPDNLTPDEARKWTDSVTEAFAVVVADAHKGILIDRTFATMRDLGLGDDGNGGIRAD